MRPGLEYVSLRVLFILPWSSHGRHALTTSRELQGIWLRIFSFVFHVWTTQASYLASSADFPCIDAMS